MNRPCGQSKSVRPAERPLNDGRDALQERRERWAHNYHLVQTPIFIERFFSVAHLWPTLCGIHIVDAQVCCTSWPPFQKFVCRTNCGMIDCRLTNRPNCSRSSKESIRHPVGMIHRHCRFDSSEGVIEAVPEPKISTGSLSRLLRAYEFWFALGSWQSVGRLKYPTADFDKKQIKV